MGGAIENALSIAPRTEENCKFTLGFFTKVENKIKAPTSKPKSATKWGMVKTTSIPIF